MDTRTIHTDFYTEGPVIDSSGNIFVTNITGGQILKIAQDDSLKQWATCHSPNGQFIASNGDHLVCNSLHGSIERFTNEGTYLGTFFKGEIENYIVRCPNDLWIGKQGVFFTDSLRHDGAVLFIAKNGSASVIAKQLDYPNGIVYDEQLNCLYVAESFKNRILKIDLSQENNPISVLVDLPFHPSGQQNRNLPDGLFLEKNERLWIAHYGMNKYHCYHISRQVLESFDSPITLTSNIYVNDSTIVLTGGEGEPGPGKICIITI